MKLKFANHCTTSFAAAALVGGMLLAACQHAGTNTDSTLSPKKTFAINAARGSDGGIVMTAAGQRDGDIITWRINGIEQPASTGASTIDVTPLAGEITTTALLARDGKNTATDRLRLYGQELTATPPVMDGMIGDDWNDPPVAWLRPTKQINFGHAVGDADYHARLRTLWEADGGLWVGVEIYPPPPVRGDYPDPLITLFISPFDEPEEARTITIDAKQDFSNPVGTILYRGNTGDALRLPVAATLSNDVYTLETRIDARDLGFAPSPGTLLNFQAVISRAQVPLVWNADPDGAPGLAIILPDPAALPPGPGRQQLHNGETKPLRSDTATTDPAYLTPLPVEKPGTAAYIPEGFDLKAPWEGTFELENAYGYESQSWTHQTIGNRNSANDFFAIDVKMPTGTPILATANGRIVQAGRRADSYGNYVVIDHGAGIQSIYAHLDSLVFDVDKGEPEIYVEQGRLLGLSGSTGTSRPHLHFALHTGARASHSGANVGGLTTVPEPLSGYYGLRQGHLITSTNVMK